MYIYLVTPNFSFHIPTSFVGHDACVGSEEAGRYAGLEGEEMLVGIRRVLSGPHLHVVTQPGGRSG